MSSCRETNAKTSPLQVTWRTHCAACGRVHEPAAHHDPEAMDREAARALEAGDWLGAAIWRARAASTRGGKIMQPRKGQTSWR